MIFYLKASVNRQVKGISGLYHRSMVYVLHLTIDTKRQPDTVLVDV